MTDEQRQIQATEESLLCRAVRGLAAVAMIFSLLVCVLLAASIAQTRGAAPLDSPALQRLITELQSSPDNAQLKEQIRELDLLARNAYFTGQSFRRTGAWMLLTGVAIALAAWKWLSAVRRRVQRPSECKGMSPSAEQPARSRRAVAVVGISLVAAAIILPLALRDDQVGTTPADADGHAGQDNQAQAAPETDSPPPRAEILKNWPCFRGPDGTGVAYCTRAPLTWNGKTGEGIRWSTPVDKPGFSSPIVWGSRVFLSTADADSLEILCFDAETGAVKWRKAVQDIPGSPAKRPEVTEDTGYAAPTMATDGRRVFAIFATGDVVCLDLEGTQVWARNLGVPENHYGHSSSLLVYRDRLLVQYDHSAGSRVLALSGRSGETLWETTRRAEISWASPILAQLEGRTEIVLNASPIVAGYSPDTGAELWSIDCMAGEVAPSPAYAAGLVFVTNEYAVLAAIDLATREVVWQTDEAELPDVCSPVASPEYLFLGSNSGMVTCLEAKTGKKRWEHEFGDGFYASPILVGARVYFTDQKGITHVIQAGPEFKLLGDADIGESVVSTPAFAHGRMYVRGVEHLYCIGD